MELLWWILIITSFLLSFIGLIYPIIPSSILIWVGVVVFHFLLNGEALSWWTWGTLITFTLLLFIVDYLANLYFVEKYGGTKWGMRAATIGLIVGSFIFPPFGILIVPFALVFLTELSQKKAFKDSLKVAFGTLIAFLSGTFAKAVIQLVIIGIFFIDVLF